MPTFHHRFIACCRRAVCIVLVTMFLGNGAAVGAISYLELAPGRGDGILQLLREAGLPANGTSLQTFKNLNAQLLGGSEELKAGVRYRLPVISITAGESFDAVLMKLGVHQFRDIVFRYNREHNDRFPWQTIGDIPAGQVLLVPEIRSGFYEASFVEEYAATPEEPGVDGDGLSLPYPDIKNAVTPGAVSTVFDDYFFVLDAGHGGNDPGTMPVVLRGDGLNAQVYEAALVYDTTLRLMKHLILNGGDVFLTHFSPDHGISDEKNPQEYGNHRYNLSSQNINRDTPAQSIRTRKGIVSTIIDRNYHKGRKIVFISIHADYIPDKEMDLPITVFYHRRTDIDRNASKNFAARFAEAITGSAGNIRVRGLDVLYRNPADLEVLVELANLNNQNGAWRLRYHEYREKLARILCDGLRTSLE